MNLQNLSNKELYALCKQYGKNVRKWSREFGFLLPEVARRKMYRKYRCTSIYEFAAKLAGMSYDITSRILNLSLKLTGKPVIWNEFKKYGWTKLTVIADAVTVDTQEFWLDKLKKLPRHALQEYLKAWKKNNKISDFCEDKPSIDNLFTLVAQKNCETQTNSSPEPKIRGSTELGYEIQPVNVQNTHNTKTFRKLRLRVDAETEFEFRKFKQAMEKEKKTALTMGETLKFLLAKVKELEQLNHKKITKTTQISHESEMSSVVKRINYRRQIQLIATSIRNEDQPIEKWEFDTHAGQQSTISIVTPRQSTNNLENIFRLYQHQQKSEIDLMVRDHWNT